MEVKIRMALGCGLHHIGRHDEAVVEFEEAAQLQPGNWRVQANLAIFYNEMGEFLSQPRSIKDAIDRFNIAVALAPIGRIRDQLEVQRNDVAVVAADETVGGSDVNDNLLLATANDEL